MQVISKLMCFFKSWFNSYLMTFSFFMKKGPTLVECKDCGVWVGHWRREDLKQLLSGKGAGKEQEKGFLKGIEGPTWEGTRSL